MFMLNCFKVVYGGGVFNYVYDHIFTYIACYKLTMYVQICFSYQTLKTPKSFYQFDQLILKRQGLLKSDWNCLQRFSKT